MLWETSPCSSCFHSLEPRLIAHRSASSALTTSWVASIMDLPNDAKTGAPLTPPAREATPPQTTAAASLSSDDHVPADTAASSGAVQNCDNAAIETDSRDIGNETQVVSLVGDVDEGIDGYCPGGFHPVYIGDVFADKYQVLNKIGYGVYGTVWIARDLTKK